MKKFSLLIILVILILTVATGCSKQVFDGSRTGNDEQFIMDYSVLNTTETHEMELKQGMIIKVNIESISGHVDILVTGDDGVEIIGSGNDSSSNFSFEIPKTGTYTFSVTGNKAKGSVSFKIDK